MKEQAEILGERKKCVFCKKEVIGNYEVAMFHKGFFYHDDCFAKFDGVAIKNAKLMLQDKQELVRFINTLFGFEVLPPKVNLQIMKYINSNYTYSGIHKTLEYFYITKKNSLDKANGGIGIVAHVYDEARAHFLNAHKNKQTLEISRSRNSEILNAMPTIIEITVGADDTKNKKMISIEDL